MRRFYFLFSGKGFCQYFQKLPWNPLFFPAMQPWCIVHPAPLCWSFPDLPARSWDCLAVCSRGHPAVPVSGVTERESGRGTVLQMSVKQIELQGRESGSSTCETPSWRVRFVRSALWRQNLKIFLEGLETQIPLKPRVKPVNDYVSLLQEAISSGNGGSVCPAILPGHLQSKCI